MNGKIIFTTIPIKSYIKGKRPTKDEYYLKIAEAVSRRSTCLIRKYGAVIVANDEIISTGYNGAPRGQVNCIDDGVCQKRLFSGSDAHGVGYDNCKSVHAEMNAIISAKRRDMIGATLYLTCYDVCGEELIYAKPCSICKRLIINSGILRVVTWQV